MRSFEYSVVHWPHISFRYCSTGTANNFLKLLIMLCVLLHRVTHAQICQLHVYHKALSLSQNFFKGLIRILQKTKQFNWCSPSLQYTYSLFSTFPMTQSRVWHVITFRIPKIQYIAGWTILLWCIGNQIARKVCTNQEFLFSWLVFICKSQILSRQSRFLYTMNRK